MDAIGKGAFIGVVVDGRSCQGRVISVDSDGALLTSVTVDEGTPCPPKEMTFQAEDVRMVQPAPNHVDG